MHAVTSPNAILTFIVTRNLRMTQGLVLLSSKAQQLMLYDYVMYFPQIQTSLTILNTVMYFHESILHFPTKGSGCTYALPDDDSDRFACILLQAKNPVQILVVFW